MNVVEGLFYTSDHEWLKVEGNIGYIGVTDFAQGELGDIVFISIESSVSEIVKGETFGTIEAVKTVADINAPVSGKLIEVNAKLENDPQLVNSDPYGEGWIVKIELTNLDETKELMDAEAYKAQLG
ncbi:MAG TPA: glycine cleavage system protein GcvH [Melioribacteraceae bacterium]|nr:glycine cleavage system protein GcvH [Melioribacteraceae bacterium]